MTAITCSAHTALNDIPLPFMDVVLAERFLLPAESLKRFHMPVPQSIQEVADLSGLPVEHIIKVFEECLSIDKLIWLSGTADDFAGKEGTWIVDMRPMVGYDVDPLHPSARIFHHGNQAQQLELMRRLDRIIVLSAPSSHAWSAAMALRLMSIKSFLLM